MKIEKREGRKMKYRLVFRQPDLENGELIHREQIATFEETTDEFATIFVARYLRFGSVTYLKRRRYREYVSFEKLSPDGPEQLPNPLMQVLSGQPHWHITSMNQWGSRILTNH